MKKWKLSIKVTATLILSLLMNSFTLGQSIGFDDLVRIHNMKNSIQIDEYLNKIEGWNCACYRELDNMELQDLWVFNLDTLKNYSDRTERIEISRSSQYYQERTEYFTADETTYKNMVNDIQDKGFIEEGIKEHVSDTLRAKLSFFVSDKLVIQIFEKITVNDQDNKFTFILLDKKDYESGLIIK